MAELTRRSFFKKLIPSPPNSEALEGEQEGKILNSPETVSGVILPTRIERAEGDPTTSQTARILENCITKQRFDCELCRSACPQVPSVISISTRGVAVVDAKRCQGCGQCLSACLLIPKAIELQERKAPL